MSILTREEILKEIENKALVITPFSKDQVGPASVDLHLGPEFRMFKKVHKTFVVDDAASSEKELTERTIVKQGDHYLLTPGETVIAITQERVKLPPYLCGWLEGRGRFARLGLDIRIGAGFVQPGTDNQVFFTITNQGPAANVDPDTAESVETKPKMIEFPQPSKRCFQTRTLFLKLPKSTSEEITKFQKCL